MGGPPELVNPAERSNARADERFDNATSSGADDVATGSSKRGIGQVDGAGVVLEAKAVKE